MEPGDTGEPTGDYFILNRSERGLRKQITILGSTGSIGKQALEVVRNHPDRFGVEVLTAQNSCDLLIEQAIEFQPNAVVIGNPDCYPKLHGALGSYPIKVYAGEDAISQIVEMDGVDIILNALVGYAGMIPTYKAVTAGKRVALANKESLVIAGELIIAEAARNRVPIIPVDSEHSAIFQCLVGEDSRSVEKIYLTASGGPFRGMTRSEIEQSGVKEALMHPNWSMGNKITIDSATMMNKGLEVIEAHWLFGLPADRIEVIVHPQSVIHSMVQFKDGSLKAQMGVPDMRLPILYALGFPERIPADTPRIDFSEYSQLTFEQPDHELFRNLSLAYQALDAAGTAPCVLNAANEMAVTAFLQQQLPFLGIAAVVEMCLESMPHITNPGLDDFISTHHQTTEKANQIISEKSWKY
ncbi:MAG: 1-deoxy-D-xylulose-5-phosphate reductoisomerase [Bacteroidales bacterium]|nr:1-deoxy-D-xylulose-5-phosphate reductoisomerase [Bacteroidales bacterium]